MTFEEVKKVTEILLEFLPNTLKLFAWTIVLSIPVGVLVTMLKKCRFKPISWLTNLYILVMRGTPLMLQIIAIYYAVPLIIASAAKQGKTGGVYDVLTNIKNNENYMFIALVTAFVLNYAAYFAEIFRIILPQVTKRVIPATSNEVIVLVKDTSLANVIAFAEITMKAKQQMNLYSSITPLFIAGAFYFVLNAIVTVAFAVIEKKFDYYK